MRLPAKVAVPLVSVWLIILLCGMAGYVLPSVSGRLAALQGSLQALLAVLFLVSWVYLSLRLWFFRKRLVNFFRRILAGEYVTGVRPIAWLDDEIADLTARANRAMDQLRTYDELRADRTGLSYRALDLVFVNAKICLILVHAAKKQIRLNPALQSAFGVAQEAYSFQAIEKQPENSRFFRSLLRTLYREKVAREGRATLQLPQRESALEISYRMVPLKDKSEKVQTVVIFVEPQSAVSTAESPQETSEPQP